MRARNLWISALLALALPVLALADEPLTPPEDFIHDTDAATVRGDVARNRTTITQHGVPGSPNWSIPVWARFYSLSPLADSVLVLNPGGNLIGTRDPHQVVMTVWYLEGDTVRQQPFALLEVMDPADMPQTASHYLWLESYTPTETGWRLQLADGRSITVTYR